MYTECASVLFNIRRKRFVACAAIECGAYSEWVSLNWMLQWDYNNNKNEVLWINIDKLVYSVCCRSDLVRRAFFFFLFLHCLQFRYIYWSASIYSRATHTGSETKLMDADKPIEIRIPNRHCEISKTRARHPFAHIQTGFRMKATSFQFLFYFIVFGFCFSPDIIIIVKFVLSFRFGFRRHTISYGNSYVTYVPVAWIRQRTMHKIYERSAATTINSTGKRLRWRTPFRNMCGAHIDAAATLTHESTVRHIGSSVFVARLCGDVCMWECAREHRKRLQPNGTTAILPTTIILYSIRIYVLPICVRLFLFVFVSLSTVSVPLPLPLHDGRSQSRVRTLLLAYLLPIACRWNVVPSTDWWYVCDR